MAERLDAIQIQASSPDGNIEGTYRPNGGVTLRFRGDSYHCYTERDLEHQLTQLATLMSTRYRHTAGTVVAEVAGRPLEKKRTTPDATNRRFLEERAKIVAEGMSSGGFVYITNTGTRNWRIVIRDGTLAELDEEACIAEALSGYGALTRDCRSKTAELRTKHYGPSIGEDIVARRRAGRL